MAAILSTNYIWPISVQVVLFISLKLIQQINTGILSPFYICGHNLSTSSVLVSSYRWKSEFCQNNKEQTLYTAFFTSIQPQLFHFELASTVTVGPSLINSLGESPLAHSLSHYIQQSSSFKGEIVNSPYTPSSKRNPSKEQ